ncbi:MAG: anaerobic ribonucleoside-triphosphate reductase activating protein [Clostridia bacterium]|nr:anaerobic ribonucleoside-triphosphate reductase activating protein [Clostridia bacterium]
MGKLRIAGVVKESIVDGPGIRYVVFTQGCPHKCIGCHNPQTHDFNSGYVIDTDKIYDEVLENPLIKGITLSGGEPFAQAKELAILASNLRQKNYDVIVYTGYTFESLVENSNESNGYLDLIENSDALIDGKFEIDKMNKFLKFRGSENQRVIDCVSSLNSGEIVIKEL